MGATMDQSGPTKVIQVTNIAPQATKDQMQTLFSYVGKVEDLRLYPTIRDAGANVTSRCCFVKFNDSSCIPIAQHLTNTVFIDRAIIVTPVICNDVPEEQDGLTMALQFQQQGSTGNGVSRLGGSVLNGTAVSSTPVETPDMMLESLGLPPYPVLPAGTPMGKVDEIRRTVTLVGIDSTVSAQACMEMFAEAGEVKYFRYCTKIGDPVKYALIEFTHQDSVSRALQMNDRTLGMTKIKVTHATQAITKPQAKTSEAVQREIEEAMSKVKETQSLVSAAVDPLMGMLGGVSARSSLTRSRSRSKSRRRSRSRERSYHSSRRSRSRDRDRRRGGRSRSRSRERRRSKSRERRRRSRSRDKKRSKRSRSKSRERRRRSRSRDKKKDKDKSETPQTETTADPKKESKERDVEEPSKKSRSRSQSKKRSKSRDRKKKSRSKSRDRKRSRSRDRKSRRSTSRDRRRKRSRSRKRSKDRSSKSSSSKKSKDNDAKEVPPAKEETPKEVAEDKKDSDDMEISNSP